MGILDIIRYVLIWKWNLIVCVVWIPLEFLRTFGILSDVLGSDQIPFLSTPITSFTNTYIYIYIRLSNICL